MNAARVAVTLLGTKGGPAVYPGSPMPTSSLVTLGGERIVVDCGLGVTRALAGQGVRLPEIRTIVITHLHSDHYLELGPADPHGVDRRTEGQGDDLRPVGPGRVLAAFPRLDGL